MASIHFTSSDVWLLLAIALAQSNDESAHLKDIFHAGDAVNKSIFTPQELRRGLAKLLKAGFIAEAGHPKFTLLPAGRDLMERAGYGRRSWFNQWDFLERELHATRGPEDSPTFESDQWSYSKLTTEDIANAEQEYREEFERRLSEIQTRQ